MKADFRCDKCGRDFYEMVAYSVARDWEEFDEYHTYCSDCVEKEESKKYINIDGRSMNKSGRTYQLGTRVRKEFVVKLKRIAEEERLKLVEVLERSLECYERCKK